MAFLFNPAYLHETDAVCMYFNIKVPYLLEHNIVPYLPVRASSLLSVKVCITLYSTLLQFG